MLSRYRVAAMLGIVLLAALVASCSGIGNVSISLPGLGGHQQAQSGAAKGAFAFVPNPGLGQEGILFRTLGASRTLYFARHEVLFSESCSAEASTPLDDFLAVEPSQASAPEERTALRLQFVGASAKTSVVGEEELDGIVNYYLGDDSTNWHSGVPTYGRITYRELYPGIDLLQSGTGGGLKGTYVVAPEGDPADIRWRYEGASQVKLRKGELLIASKGTGEEQWLVERRPIAWQEHDGDRTPVRASYVQHRDGSVGIRVGRYDTTRPLIIDPVLDYASYWGEDSCEGAYDIATDAGNNVYITGPTNARFFPAQVGDCAGEEYYDIFITKLDPSLPPAEQHIYTTILGGGSGDTALSIGVDGEGRAYVAGYSGSDDFPTTAGNALRPNFGGGWVDGIVVQLGAAGVVEYASYLGGSEMEEAFQAAVTEAGLIYVTGFTDSADFPITPDAYSDELDGWRDAFVSVLDTSKSGADSLVYSTFFGGAGADEGYGLAALDGFVYLAGTTTSTDLPTKNPTQPNYGGGGGYGDAFVAKIDPSATGDDQLLFGTYLGGNESEVCGFAAVDGDENMYLVGATESANFPTTGGEAFAGGGYDAFVTKWDTKEATLVYSQLLGGSGKDGLRQVVADDRGYAYVAGGTGSPSLSTEDPIQGHFRGGTIPEPDWAWVGPGDGWIAAFDPLGTMTFSTYLGGTGADGASALRLGADRRLYVAMATRSTDLTTVNAVQEGHGGACDSFVVIIDDVVPCAEMEKVQVSGPITMTVGHSSTLTAAVSPLTAHLPVTYTWRGSEGAEPQTIVRSGDISDTATITWTSIGSQVVTMTAVNACSTVSTTHAITVETDCEVITSLYLAGPLTATVEAPATFSAVVGPVTASQPITYTWQATEQTPRIHGDANSLTDTVDLTWEVGGRKTVSVTASNACSVLASAPRHIDVEEKPQEKWSVYLPLLVRGSD